MCLYPTLLKNRKYTANKKNGGLVPPLIDLRAKYVPIGCQDCIECRKQKAREWQVRLQEDIKEHKNGKFVTLTFSNESYKYLTENPEKLKTLERIKNLEGYQRDNQLATTATRLFLERYRKKYTKSLRHWLVSEIGHQGTENIHLHGIIWTNETLETIEKIWSYGYIWKGKIVKNKLQNYVNAKTINYIIKYITKKDEKHTTYKSIILTTPGIGANYTKGHDHKQNKYIPGQTNETFRTNTGHKIALPIYWRNKIYNEEEREKLWLEKLDKQERWICGEKVNISKNENEYYKLLKYHQDRNRSLGYGNGEKSWEQWLYENQRRDLMNEKRKNAFGAKYSKGTGLDRTQERQNKT